MQHRLTQDNKEEKKNSLTEAVLMMINKERKIYVTSSWRRGCNFQKVR
jgi:hypothetical protein